MSKKLSIEEDLTYQKERISSLFIELKNLKEKVETMAEGLAEFVKSVTVATEEEALPRPSLEGLEGQYLLYEKLDEFNPATMLVKCKCIAIDLDGRFMLVQGSNSGKTAWVNLHGIRAIQTIDEYEFNTGHDADAETGENL